MCSDHPKKHIFKKWVADPSRRRQQSRTCKLNLGKRRIHSDLAQELQILQHVLRKIKFTHFLKLNLPGGHSDLRPFTQK